MDCRFDKDILQHYIDGTIEPLETIFLQEHLKYCRECEGELKLLKAVDEGLYAVFQKDISSSREDTSSEAMDLLIKNICASQIEENSNIHPLTTGVKTGAALSWSIVLNITKFVKYIPGANTIRKGAQKAVGLGRFLRIKK